MFAEESVWIRGVYDKLDPNRIKKVGNLGSSSLEFRTRIQPHIHTNIIKPLQDKGIDAINIDLKKESGVDVIGDITTPEFGTDFQNQFDLILCTNLLEHVMDINLVINNLVQATRNNGYILLTVPYKYKLHLDPIDNGFRPTPNQIADLFVGTDYRIVNSQIISINNNKEYKIKKSKLPLWGYRERVLYYLGKRYKVSGILLQIVK